LKHLLIMTSAARTHIHNVYTQVKKILLLIHFHNYIINYS